MLRFLIRRLLWSLLVLLFILTITFTLTYLLPADPVRTLLGPHATPETIAKVRHQLHLDDSFGLRYLKYIGGVLTGDLGYSYRVKLPVLTILLSRFPATLALAVATVLIQTLL